MSSNPGSGFSSLFVKINLYQHFVAFILLPLLVLLPFSIYLAGLTLRNTLTMALYISFGELEELCLTIAYIVDYFSGTLALILVTASYFLYRGALKCAESRRWLIVLPIIWAYPIPITAYTVVTHHDYFLKALTGDKEVYEGYHFPRTWGMLLALFFIGLIIAIVYTTINIYVHVKLVRDHCVYKNDSPASQQLLHTKRRT